MEAECARADLEFLRQDVWDKVRPGSFRRNKFLSALIAFSRPAFLALLIILLAVVPISREIPAPAVKYDRSKIVLAEPVIIIREDKDGKGTVIDMNAPPVNAKTNEAAVTPAPVPASTKSEPEPEPVSVLAKNRKVASNAVIKIN